MVNNIIFFKYKLNRPNSVLEPSISNCNYYPQNINSSTYLYCYGHCTSRKSIAAVVIYCYIRLNKKLVISVHDKYMTNYIKL